MKNVTKMLGRVRHLSPDDALSTFAKNGIKPRRRVTFIATTGPAWIQTLMTDVKKVRT